MPNAVDIARFPAKGKPKKTADDPDGDWEMMLEADRDAVNRIMANQVESTPANAELSFV